VHGVRMQRCRIVGCRSSTPRGSASSPPSPIPSSPATAVFYPDRHHHHVFRGQRRRAPLFVLPPLMLTGVTFSGWP
jgi:hypothetical protein